MAIHRYHRKDGSTSFVADFYDQDHRRLRKFFESEKEARDYETVSRAEIIKHKFVRPGTEHVSDLAALWLDSIKAQKRADCSPLYASATLAAYEYHLRHFILPELGALRLWAANDCETLERAFAKWAARVSAYQARAAAQTLARIFDMAVRYQKIGSNNVRVAVKPKIAPEDDPAQRVVEESEVYSADELNRIIEATETATLDRMLVLLLAFTGMRIGEAMGLCWDMVDLKERKIYVLRALKPGGELGPVKSKAGRRLFDNLPPLLMRELMVWKLKCPNSPEGFVLTHNGKPLNKKYTWYRLHATMKRAGVRLMSHHDFRHTFASQLYKAGVDDAEVARLLGHSSAEITRRVYVHFVRNQASTAIADLAKLILGE